MSSNEKSGDSIHINIQGSVSGQFAAGQGISQENTISASGGAISEADLAELRHVFDSLQAQVETQAPPAQKTSAMKRMRQLQKAVTARKPDLTTMAHVRDWFAKHLPALAGSVGTVVVHPIVGRLVEAAGDTLAAEWRRRFRDQANL